MAERDDAGQAEVQARTDEAEAVGYIGSVPDDTPNEAYSVDGVTSGTEAADADREAATGGNGGTQDAADGAPDADPDAGAQ